MSRDKIDHKAEALAMLTPDYADPRNPAHAAGQEALVHATLYAAEQQWIANLIAITAMSWPTQGSDVTKQWDGEADTEEWRAVRNKIAESLGLA